MSEMEPLLVERVAKAICRSQGLDPEALLLVNPPRPTWSRYISSAGAAIAAVREQPTDAAHQKASQDMTNSTGEPQ